ncbi:MAG: hypothetical protein ABSH03_21780 [Candidatus Lustribacter sp.]|jgi:hypothetical protein
MTDDELDRALFALPLEQPPPDLHGKILAATVLRPVPTFRQWELWALGAALVLIGWLTVWAVSTTPEAGSRFGYAIVVTVRALGLFSRSTYVWLAVGLSSVWWISSLPFMATPRSTVYNR